MRIKQMLYADSSLGKVQAVFSPKVKHRARVQLTIGQRTRVFPGVAREPVADHWLSRGTRARGAKPFFSAASAKSQACPKHFHGVRRTGAASACSIQRHSMDTVCRSTDLDTSCATSRVPNL